MITIRKSSERGHAHHGWLESRHSFSFADYHDPQHMGFASLRVINEDIVQPGMGFGTHGHRDMEIITYILEGALAHRDSMGNGSVIRAGDVQRMSAGRGVQHSEFNHSPDALVHFLQIWILPSAPGIEPGYEEKNFDSASKRGTLHLIASPDGRDGSLRIHQDAAVYAALLDGAERLSHPLVSGRCVYVHVARGTATINGQALLAGDAAKIQDEPMVTLEQGDNAEILLFDLV